MILLLGGTGYIGGAFAAAMQRRQLSFKNLSRCEVDYTNPIALANFLREQRPEFVMNAAGYTGKPNVDACESRSVETIAGNVEFPRQLAIVCAEAGVPFAHVSSGCIYTGCKVATTDGLTVERDVNSAYVRRLAIDSPNSIQGFDETHEPNFTRSHGVCSLYSHTKALGESAIKGIGEHYIWRLRIPFDAHDGPRNYLSKLQSYPKVYSALNSLSHRSDFVEACLESWARRIPFGVYNVTNPGYVSTEYVVERIRKLLGAKKEFKYWKNDKEFYQEGAIARRSNCVLNSDKLARAGIKLRPIEEALDDALQSWRPAMHS